MKLCAVYDDLTTKILSFNGVNLQVN